MAPPAPHRPPPPAPRRRRPPAVPGSWSIVTTLRGAPGTVVPFIAHHLASDVERIHVHLDDDDPVLIALLAPLPRVTVTVCDAAYWAASRAGARPPGIIARQLANASHARRQTDSEWLVHIDMDEFLVPPFPGAPTLSEELAAQPAGIDWLRIRNIERILPRDRPQVTIFDGFFREPTPDAALAREIYGDDSRFLKRGFSGYVRGKMALRVRSKLLVGVHDAPWPGRRGVNLADADLPPYAIPETRLLHFDGWTGLHWTTKLLRHLDNVRGSHGGRRNQYDFMRATTDDAARHGLFDRLQRVSPEAEALLRRHGLIHDIAFDPRPAVRACFPGQDYSFLVADFDADLRRTEPDLQRPGGGGGPAPGA